MKILVLAGGVSREREMRIRSGKATKTFLEMSGHSVSIIDPAEGLENHTDFIKSFDVAVIRDEDGAQQKILEDIGIPYVGSDSKSSALCFDKWKYKKLLKSEGIKVPSGELIRSYKEYQDSIFSKSNHILKPFDGGSSIDMLFVRNPNTIDTERIKYLIKNNHMMIEELIEGQEITSGVLDGYLLPIVEINPPQNEDFNVQNKYNGKTEEICPAKNIPTDIQKEAQNIAKKVHKICGCRHLSRTDMIIDEHGEIYVLETNTMPGMSAQSLFPKEAKAVGLKLDELLDYLVVSAYDNYKNNFAINGSTANVSCPTSN